MEIKKAENNSNFVSAKQDVCHLVFSLALKSINSDCLDKSC